MSQGRLLDPACLFRFEVPIEHQSLAWGAMGLQLDPACTVPNFSVLSGGTPWAQVRFAWNVDGIGLWVQVKGKKQIPRCRPQQVQESDGIQLFLATRNVSEVHRGNRFCHSLFFSPLGGGTKREAPFSAWRPLEMAREVNDSLRQSPPDVHAKLLPDGYQLSGRIPASSLHGFDPREFSLISMSYLVKDHELGVQPWTVGEEFPIRVDPSLWVLTRLVGAPRE